MLVELAQAINEVKGGSMEGSGAWKQGCPWQKDQEESGLRVGSQGHRGLRGEGQREEMCVLAGP